MSGHVFHPGHSDLHGITVVLEAAGDVLYVGRYHEETPRGVLLHDVAEHRGTAERKEFVQRTLKFGVRAQHPHVVVPSTEVRRIVRLVEWGEGTQGG
jgi:hypothetical protein